MGREKEQVRKRERTRKVSLERTKKVRGVGKRERTRSIGRVGKRERTS